jgi:hypothetical protein
MPPSNIRSLPPAVLSTAVAYLQLQKVRLEDLGSSLVDLEDLNRSIKPSTNPATFPLRHIPTVLIVIKENAVDLPALFSDLADPKCSIHPLYMQGMLPKSMLWRIDFQIVVLTYSSI